MITNQKDLRRMFWDDNPQCAKGRLRNGDRPTDTRVAWCDYVESMSRNGIISEAMAQRATLDP